MTSRPYDALLLVSFGGPEGPEDVLPFLQNVTAGRQIPIDRLEAVGQHYFHFGGISPINQQNRELLVALRSELDRRAIELPLYWGNRNWSPMLPDVLASMRDDGITNALAFFTSAYSSYSGCRQYRENLADARSGVGELAPSIERIGPYFNHPGFVEPFIDETLAALSRLDAGIRRSAHLLFTTHSIPIAMAHESGVREDAYVEQHLDVAEIVATEVSKRADVTYPWQLVYQSRSGPPSVPWLEPDIEDRLRSLDAEGVRAVVVIPIGFVSDHLEVLWDLDTQAQQLAQSLGLAMERARTPGTDPRFVSMIVELLQERVVGVARSERPRLGRIPAAADRCPSGCCVNPAGWRSAIGGDDDADRLDMSTT